MELFQFEFIQNAIYAAILASIACGIVGSFVVIKRLVFIAGGIAHAAFGGIGIGYYLGINPLFGIMPFSLLSALGMGIISRKRLASEDSLIGIIWALGMSIGVIFMGLTPGYVPDLQSYLFGNILTVPRMDVWLMMGLNFVILVTVGLLYKELLALCFDEESAEVLGVKVTFLYLLLLCLVAITVVILVRIVGIVLVIALLTIPASIAKQFTSNLKVMMGISIVLGIVFTLGGLALSYAFDLASGASIIILSSVGFVISLVVKKFINK